MSIIPPKRSSKELMNIDAEGFRLTILTSTPEFWMVGKRELARRNRVIEHELDMLEKLFYTVAGRKKK